MTINKKIDKQFSWLNNIYSEKYKCRNKTNSLIKSGELKKQPCEVCGITEKINAHHDNYSKPLDIKWLCRKHHMELHYNN